MIVANPGDLFIGFVMCQIFLRPCFRFPISDLYTDVIFSVYWLVIRKAE